VVCSDISAYLAEAIPLTWTKGQASDRLHLSTVGGVFGPRFVGGERVLERKVATWLFSPFASSAVRSHLELVADFVPA